MSANTAKYLLSIAGIDSKCFDVIGFSGKDTICSPYWFDIEFRMSPTAKTVPPLTEDILNKPCRLDIERNGETIPYCGIVVEFGVCDYDDASYSIRLAPRMHRLEMNFSSRIFQNLTIPEIIESVVKEADLKEYFRFEIKPNIVKYPKREFCVQYQETDLAFISRLMEESGIWYYFEQVKQPTGALNECAVVTDVFSSFPMLGRSVQFKRGSGLAEITKTGDIVESINYISFKAALMSEIVRVRAYDHRYPEGTPDGFGDVPNGHSGRVYEYGGIVRNCDEASHKATLSARRTWIESSNADGKSNCAAFRAGLRVPIIHKDNQKMSGEYLLMAVKHVGGWDKGAYTYRNEFDHIRAEKGIYAPPLRTPVPRIDGVTTAPVGAAGDLFPTINEYGHYNVNMPFVINDGRDRKDTYDYGGSKDIRLAQPSSGMSDGKPYGIHFPSKRGAEMVLAYVDGNPDRPLGLGFVPNAAAPSVACTMNQQENVMRSWGGSELLMDDTHSRKYARLSTPDKRHLELHDGNKLVRAKSENCEMLFNDAKKYAEIKAGKNVIRGEYTEERKAIAVTTEKECMIEMDDEDDTIAFQSAGEEGGEKVNNVILNGNDKSIILDSADNTIALNGQDNRITMESGDNKFLIDGKEKKVALMANEENSLVIDGDEGSISLNAKNNITIRAGGKVVIDAKGGVFQKGLTINITKPDQANSQMNSVVSERRAEDVAVGAGTGSRKGSGGDATSAEEEERLPTMEENEKTAPTNTTATEEENNEENAPTNTNDTEEEDDMEPRITEIYWTYGEDSSLLPDKYPHYVDLNLHIKTEGYNDEETVDITFKREDGKTVFNTTEEFSESAIIHGNEAILRNVLGKYKLYLDKDNMPVIVAKDEISGISATAKPIRPRWDDVFKGYPSENNGQRDIDAQTVFNDILGPDYERKHPGVFRNACATRVSIALFKSGMKLRKDFTVQEKGKLGKDGFEGEGFIASARGLKEWLANPNIWGPPDETISGENSLDKVAEIINGKDGVYIILGEGNKDVKDHATLWIGANNDVIGGNNLLGNGGMVYFWELKRFVERKEAPPETSTTSCQERDFTTTGIERIKTQEGIDRARRMAIVYAMAEWAMIIECNVLSHSEIGLNTYIKYGKVQTTNRSEEITGISVRNLSEVKNINSEIEIQWLGSIETKEGENLIHSHNLDGKGTVNANDDKILQEVIDRAINSGIMRIVGEEITMDPYENNTHRINVNVEFRWEEPCNDN